MKISKQDHDQAIARLRAMLSPGERIYTVLRHRSASGMSRRISLLLPCYDERDKAAGYKGAILGIDRLVSQALGLPVHEKGGLVITGCGMDVGFEIVYRLGQVIWPNGTPEPHGIRNGHPDSEGGYALRQSWI